jgi:hypothetical protein
VPFPLVIVCLPATIPSVGVLIAQHVPVNTCQFVKLPDSKSILGGQGTDWAVACKVRITKTQQCNTAITGNLFIDLYMFN